MKKIAKIKSTFIKYLDNKHGRLLLAIIFSLIQSFKNVGFYRVFYSKKLKFWIHTKGTRTLVIEGNPNFSVSDKRMKAVTLKNFFKHYNPKPNDIIIDIGAGVGNDVFVINTCFGIETKIYAIEAHPQTFEKLKTLIQRNNWTNVICSNVAIVELRKELMISDTDNHSANRIGENEGAIKIEGITLDEFVKNHGIHKIDYIKMNIEGAERDALLGMEHTLNKISNIVIACHDKLAKYHNNDPFYITREFVIETLTRYNFEILEEVESDYHITIFAKKRLS